MRQYNKGEWSEIYAFTHLLSSGILYAADKDLNKLEEIYFPIIKIIREEGQGEPVDYFTGDTIRIYKGNVLLKEVSRKEFAEITQELYCRIPEGTRAFPIPSTDAFFDSIYCHKVKEAVNKKQDITLQLHDINTGIKPICGFSIKSYLGANPTLVNAGTNTNFLYTIIGCTDSLMEEVNAIDTRTKLIDKMERLVEAGCAFSMHTDSISSQFIENLQFIDTRMPIILNFLVFYSYRYNLRNISEIVAKLKKKNPLQFSNPEMYTYKVKKLLSAWALGMTPERTDWMGAEDANGGYITVKKDGSVVCYHLYNRADFESYLFNYTYMDRPSTSKHHYFTIFKNGDKYQIKLCLQIRFR